MWAQTYEAARSLAHSFPGIRKIIPASIANTLKRKLRSLGISESPDRTVMTKEILPALAALKPARILFVGCQAYTARYDRWFASEQTEYWTIDVDPETARFGSPNRHVVDGVQNLGGHFAPAFFDAIVLNGVIGFGLDEPTAIAQGLRACHAVLRPGGVLLLGWNTDRSGDPLEMDAMQCCFQHRDALKIGARRRRIPGCTHVYDTCVALPG